MVLISTGDVWSAGKAMAACKQGDALDGVRTLHGAGPCEAAAGSCQLGRCLAVPALINKLRGNGLFLGRLDGQLLMPWIDRLRAA